MSPRVPPRVPPRVIVCATACVTSCAQVRVVSTHQGLLQPTLVATLAKRAGHGKPLPNKWTPRRFELKVRVRVRVRVWIRVSVRVRVRVN